MEKTISILFCIIFPFLFINWTFPNSAPFKNNTKHYKNLSVFGEMASAIYQTFYKLIFYETLIIFLELEIKLITQS